MKRANVKRPTLFKRLNAPYRVVFIDDESLVEVATFSLTKRRMYMLFSTLFVLTVIVTVMILLFTPLKYYIPGYGSNKNHIQVVKLRHQVDSLADITNAQQAYVADIRKVINGEFDGEVDTTMLDMNKVRTDAMNSIIPAPEDIKEQAALQTPAPEPAKEKRKGRGR